MCNNQEVLQDCFVPFMLPSKPNWPLFAEWAMWCRITGTPNIEVLQEHARAKHGSETSNMRDKERERERESLACFTAIKHETDYLTGGDCLAVFGTSDIKNPKICVSCAFGLFCMVLR